MGLLRGLAFCGISLVSMTAGLNYGLIKGIELYPSNIKEGRSAKKDIGLFEFSEDLIWANEYGVYGALGGAALAESLVIGVFCVDGTLKRKRKLRRKKNNIPYAIKVGHRNTKRSLEDLSDGNFS